MNMTMIKVASYNIRKAIGTDRRRRPDRIIEVLGEIGADIVALQEADRRFGAREAVLPTWMIEAHTPYHVVPLGVRAESMGWHGNALLVRRDYTLLSHDLIHLPCFEPRGAVTATLDVNGKALRVVGMHLDLSGLWRRRQAAALIHYLEQTHHHHYAEATVLMGDLNEWSSTRGCLIDFGRSFHVTRCGRSYHATRPVASLDRIMWRGALALADCGVHQSPASRRASDHLPIWAHFAI
jgi:endonuclease/exonuclease/phosphatase family metal-dependent hydrolase